MPQEKVSPPFPRYPKKALSASLRFLPSFPSARLSSGKESKPESIPPPSNLAPGQRHGVWRISVDSLNASQSKRAISNEPHTYHANRPSIRYSATYCTHNGSIYEHAPAGTRLPSPSSYSRSGYRYPLRSPRHRKNLYGLERSPCRSRRSNTVSLARPQSQTGAVCGWGDARSSHAGQTNFLG